MKNKFGNFVKIVLILILFFSAFLTPVQATPKLIVNHSEGSSGDCFSLDVIFIIDQSGSMSDPSKPSDPTKQREKAVEAMANWLTENALDHCKNARHQVGVVSFGNESRIDLPLTEISPKSFDAAVQLQKKLAENIHATDMGDTLPMGAFVLAKKMFNESVLRNIGIRKQIIIMLTDGLIHDGKGNDGKGYVVPTQELADYINENFKFDPTLKKREECINEKVITYGGDFDSVPFDQVNECMQKYDVSESAYLNSTYLYIVLMNFREKTWPKEIRDILRDVAEEHMGELMDFHEKTDDNRNRNAIPDYFRTVLAAQVGVPSGRVECGPLAVNPFLDKATFVFYKFSEDTVVKLRYTDANGKNYEISKNQPNDPSGFNVLEYDSYGANERYTILNPYPGIWYIESDRCANNGVSAFYQEVKINPGGYSLPETTIQQYDLEPYYDVTEPYYLSYEMKDEAGDIVQNSPNPFFAIDLTATVTDPNGDSIDYSMVWNDAEEKFVAVDPLQVASYGEYRVSILGKAPYYPGNKAPVTDSLATTFKQELVMFQHDDLKFTVTEVKPFRIEANEPESGQVDEQIHETIAKGWPLKVKPIPFSVNITWRDEPLDVSLYELFPEPDQAFSAWIEYPDGSKTEPITLKVDPDEPTRLVGSFENIDSEEELIIHVRMDEESNPEFRPDFRHVQIRYSRFDKSFFSKAGSYKLLVLILAGLGLLMFILQLISHFDPVGGRLNFYIAGDKNYDSIELYTGKKVTKIRKKDLQKIGLDDFDLKVMEVRYKPYEKTDIEFEIESRRDVKIKGKTDCGQNFDFELGHEQRNSPCYVHTMYEVEYVNSELAGKPKLHFGPYILSVFIPVLLIILFIVM